MIMPITEKNGKWYWGKKGPYNTKEAAQRVATAAYLSGYKNKTGVMPKKKPYKGKFIRDGKIVRKEEWEDILQSGDNFKREKEEGLHGWFSRRGGKEKGGKTQGGWIDCSSCGKKGGPKPCGRKDASKGRKRRCRPTCGACKTYKRRKGTK
tara:strand:- start:179 stop:631 length:453 start_codon:yes stop_codon:yes gene_type:complete